MDIKIGKADFAALGCEGCKKKFVCNVASNSATDKAYVEGKLGITLPRQDPPAIINNAGGEGEKGILLYLLNQGETIASMDENTNLIGVYYDPVLASPYVLFDATNRAGLQGEQSERIGKAQYSTDDATKRSNILHYAHRGIDYLYQMSISLDFAGLLPYLDPAASAIYAAHTISVSKLNFIRPDLIQILPPNAGESVLRVDLKHGENDGRKYILKVCDIKTSEFTSSFFYELAYYMVLLRTWLDNNGLGDDFDVSYSAMIFPFDIVNNSIRQDEGWQMDFSLIRDKLFHVLNNVIPSIISEIEAGDKELIECVKRSPRCQVCDYYGGQYEGELYEEYKRKGPTGKDDYKTFVEDPMNNYCRFYLNAVNDINIIPSIKTSDIKYLQDKGITDLTDLDAELHSPTLIGDNVELMSNSVGLIKEISVHGTGLVEKKVQTSNSLSPARAQLQVYTLIRQDSQRRTLSYGISYSICVYNVDKLTVTPTMNVDAFGCLKENSASTPYLVEIDCASINYKLTALIEYILKMKEILEMYNAVESIDRYGKRSRVSYGILYWGKKTYDAFRDNLQDLLEYLSQNGGTLAGLYPTLSTTALNKKNRDVRDAINAFADIFSDEEVTYYERILKSPLFDLKAIYSEVAAVDTNFSYNLIDVYNAVFGTNNFNYHYRPDSDNYSAYTYDAWYSVDRATNPGEKNRFQIELVAQDKQHFFYLSKLYNELFNPAGTLGAIVKKGTLPVLGLVRDNPGIRDWKMLYLFLYQKTNAAYEEVEVEENHVASDMKKQYGGDSIHIERTLTPAELGAFAIRVAARERAYLISATAENANLDESSFGLTIYPPVKFADTFKKVTNNPSYGGCLYVDVDLEPWQSFKRYTEVVNCGISHLDIANKAMKLSFDQSVLDIMDELERSSGYDFSRDLYVENSFKDFWSTRLRHTILDLQKPSRRNKQAIIMNPVLRHERHYTEVDVENALNTIVPTGGSLLLNSPQKRAISTLYNDNISLLWGPPGTGKSHTLGHYLLLELLERQTCKVLLLGNYTATDNLIGSLLKTIQAYGNQIKICQGLDIVRFHSSSKTLEPLLSIPGGSAREWSINDVALNIVRPFTVFSSTPDQLARIADPGTSGQNMRRKLSAIDQFDIVIVDEASQMDVGHFLTGLLRISATANTHSKIIIAGDDKQLQPIHKEEIRGTNEAWFGSIYNYFKTFKNVAGVNEFIPVALDISRRSNHCIIDFIRETFEYNSSFVPNSPMDTIAYTRASYTTPLYEATLKPEVGLALLEYDDGLSSQKNDFEIEQICGYVLEVWKYEIARFARDFKKIFSDGIGVVIPHTAQRTAIRKKLFDEFKRILPAGAYSDVEIRTAIYGAVDTVERFQGQERDLIISGYVLGNEDAIANEEAFIYDKCRLNVIISRAKFKAIIFASRELMNNISDDIEIIELQKSFQKLKDYCDSTSDITEPGWKNGRLYTKTI